MRIMAQKFDLIVNPNPVQSRPIQMPERGIQILHDAEAFGRGDSYMVDTAAKEFFTNSGLINIANIKPGQMDEKVRLHPALAKHVAKFADFAADHPKNNREPIGIRVIDMLGVAIGRVARFGVESSPSSSKIEYPPLRAVK